MLICISWGGSKDGATCWGAVGEWGLVGNPCCPVDVEQCCAPSSVLGPDCIRCVDSVVLCLGDEKGLQPVPGNNQVLFAAEKEVWKDYVKWWGEKGLLLWRKACFSRKSYRKLQLSKHGQKVSRETTDPAAPCKVSPDKVMDLPALVFWAMLLSWYV